MKDDYDLPDPPWENVCEHDVNRYQNCEKCNDNEASHADDIIKERKEDGNL